MIMNPMIFTPILGSSSVQIISEISLETLLTPPTAYTVQNFFIFSIHCFLVFSVNDLI